MEKSKYEKGKQKEEKMEEEIVDDDEKYFRESFDLVEEINKDEFQKVFN